MNKMFAKNHRETDKLSSDILDEHEGYTKIPNHVLDALCKIRIPGEAGQVLMTVIRLTYGWQKNQDKISLGLFQKKTGITRRNVVRAIKILEDMNIIVPDRNGYITIYRINFDIEQWQQKPKHKTVLKNDNTLKVFSETTTEVLSEMTPGVVRNDTESVLKTDTHKKKKEINTKETLTESENVCFSFFNFKETAEYLCKKILENNPKFKQPNINSWTTILSEIGETPDGIYAAVTWSQNHSFWKSRTLSAVNFAKHYGTIRLQMGEQIKPDDEDVHPGLPIIRAGDESIFADPVEKISDSVLDFIHEAIRECESISELKAMWNEHPEYERYDVLRKEKNRVCYRLAHRKILCSKSIEELENAVSSDEIMFIDKSADITKLYLEKYEAITGFPMDCGYEG